MKIIRNVLVAMLAIVASTATAQQFNYTTEGFEDQGWKPATSNPSIMTVATGHWKAYKGNGMTQSVTPKEGEYSLLISNKTGVITPELADGVGEVTLWAMKTASRQLIVEASRDGNTWKSLAHATWALTDKWTKYSIVINDADIRYLKFYTNSNNGVYIDNVDIRRPGIIDDERSHQPVPYWTQNCETKSEVPATAPTSPQTIVVEGQGEWVFLNAYGSTSAQYITDGSKRAIRLLKNGSYVVLPSVSNGITELSFNEGRHDRTLSIYTSEDNGTTWTLQETRKTSTNGINTITINGPSVNRIKIANESGSDADIDNITITAFPQGTRATVSTGATADVTQRSASFQSKVTSSGDRPFYQCGICWSYEATIPYYFHNLVQATELNASEGTFSTQLTGLEASRTVYARAYYTTQAGTSYGEVVTFDTPAAVMAQLSATKATEVTGESAMLSGVIINDGGVDATETGFCFIQGNDLPTVANSHVSTALPVTEGTTFSTLITRLMPQSSYTVRSYAITVAGTAYGEPITIKTGSLALPQVSTGISSDITNYCASIDGKLEDTGNGLCTVGVCYGYEANPVIGSDNCVTYSNTNSDKESALKGSSALLTNNGTFAVKLPYLDDNTTYHARAFAINAAGTVYGDDITFTTLQANVMHLTPGGSMTIQEAVSKATAGDTIILAPGTYTVTERISITAVGEPDGGNIVLMAGDGGRAVLDCSSMPLDANLQGIRLCGSYWHITHLDIVGAGDNGMLIERNKPVGGTYADIAANISQAHHNIIDNCTFQGNQDTGLQLKNAAAHNLIINCDSYNNCDPDMGDADGFAPKLTVGTGNIFVGCRAWNNSDDGWDGLLTATENGFPDDVHTILINCWAWKNGYLKNGSEGKGNGNGFKLGGNYERHNMTLVRCLSFDNLMKDIDQNHNSGHMVIINSTAFGLPNGNKNHYSYRIDEDLFESDQYLPHLVNCVSLWDGEDAVISAKYAPVRLLTGAVNDNCSWLNNPSDFRSLSPCYDDVINGVLSPRKADGSLPDIQFMTLSDNSSLIDAGTDPLNIAVGSPTTNTLSSGKVVANITMNDVIDDAITTFWAPTDNIGRQLLAYRYNGSAPDLGYAEYNADKATAIGVITLPLALTSSERQTGSSALISVYDIHGKLLATGVSSEQILRHLPRGIYILNGKKIIVR